jgi:hypothetical protein
VRSPGAARRLVTFFCVAKRKSPKKSAPDSDSRSVERDGAQAAARNTVKRGANAAAPAPQASLTVSRQHPGSLPLRGTLCCSHKRAAAQLALRAQTVRAPRPDSDSRSVEREGAHAVARGIVKRGAHAAAPAPQASLTVSRQPPFLSSLLGGSQGIQNQNTLMLIHVA